MIQQGIWIVLFFMEIQQHLLGVWRRKCNSRHVRIRYYYCTILKYCIISVVVCLALTLTFVAVCPLAPWGREGYLSLIAGSQVAWHRLAKERTSRIPTAHPHTPSSSSRTKLYSGHKARDAPRHLKHKHTPERGWYFSYTSGLQNIKELHFSTTSCFSCIFLQNVFSLYIKYHLNVWGWYNFLMI